LLARASRWICFSVVPVTPWTRNRFRAALMIAARRSETVRPAVDVFTIVVE
jgi:hypothetical protein